MTALNTLKVDPHASFNLLHALLYSLAVISLITRSSFSLLSSPSPFSAALLLLSDLVLAFMWATAQAFRYRPVRRTEFPDRLAVDNDSLPALDVIICTADPYKEPPLGVANTALSVMAFDYPADKLSVYLSDDGGSELALFALMEAAKFARHWLPFCRENGVDQRAPEAYFGSDKGRRINSDNKMKMMYQTMKENVEKAVEDGYVSSDLLNSENELALFKKWKGFTRQDHPPIIKVLLDSSEDKDIQGNAMPNLIYVSREKSRTYSHHFKAGALNVLIRVSSIMTNAPVILNLDCDMYSNDPQTPRRALCYLLDPSITSRLAFVQFPQIFHSLNKNDIYAGLLLRAFRIHVRGLDGLQGPNYVGTGAFHSRRALNGALPSSLSELHGSIKSRAGLMRSEDVLKKANEAASCAYEIGTKWGSTIGFRYGSLVEDYNTGYRLHCEGWTSVLCDPDRPAFLGEAPKTLHDSLSQCKRWIVGLYEVKFSSYSPITYGTRTASLLVGLCYAHYAAWGFWCIPISVYSFIPQLALTYEIPLFPKLSDPWFYVYAYIFLGAYGQDLLEFLYAGETIPRWWSDQRMWMIKGITCFPSATAEFLLKKMGISTQGFNVTSKVMEGERNRRYENGIFDFGIISPFFVSIGTVAILSLISFILGTIKAVRKEGSFNEMFVQLFLSGFGIANCWQVYDAMFLRRDGGRMPKIVTNISILFAGFLHFIGYFIFVG